MGFSWPDAAAAADAAGGQIETAMQLLMSGAVGGGSWADEAGAGVPSSSPSADWCAPVELAQPGWDWADSGSSLKAHPSDWGAEYAAAPAVAEAPAVVEAAAAAGGDVAWGAVPPPQMDRPPADDSEVDELMAMMLGVAC